MAHRKGLREVLGELLKGGKGCRVIAKLQHQEFYIKLPGLEAVARFRQRHNEYQVAV
jgi:hypothetical protein